MITSRSLNIDDARKNERLIYEHIGRFTVEATHIDQRLSVLLAWATGAPDRESTQRIFEGEQVSTKLRLLKRALPDDWADKERLAKAVTRIHEYRNSLAHSTVHTLFNVETGDITHIKKREYQGGTREEIYLTELETWELRASMLRMALLVLTNTFLDRHDIRQADLRELCFQAKHNPTPENLAALELILPARQ